MNRHIVREQTLHPHKEHRMYADTFIHLYEERERGRERGRERESERERARARARTRESERERNYNDRLVSLKTQVIRKIALRLEELAQQVCVCVCMCVCMCVCVCVCV